MTKLIIQIPCYNEEDSLPITLAALPRELAGIDEIEWLVIDDGSEDRTAEVAKEQGVNHIVRLPYNRGLSAAFVEGLRVCLELGADIIVNTDADNQYRGADIAKLVLPILSGDAEIVIGARPIDKIQHFSLSKKILQRIGSAVVRLASGTDIADAPSGFRAMTRDVAMRIHVFNDFTYTLETIIQAGRNNMKIISVPIDTNPDLRKSRLVKGIGNYIVRSLFVIFRIFIAYKPLLFFWILGGTITLFGFGIGFRYLYYYVIDEGSGHIQSLLLGTLFLTVGFLIMAMGLLADQIGVNRKLLEMIDWRQQKLAEEIRNRAPRN